MSSTGFRNDILVGCFLYRDMAFSADRLAKVNAYLRGMVKTASDTRKAAQLKHFRLSYDQDHQLHEAERFFYNAIFLLEQTKQGEKNAELEAILSPRQSSAHDQVVRQVYDAVNKASEEAKKLSAIVAEGQKAAQASKAALDLALATKASKPALALAQSAETRDSMLLQAAQQRAARDSKDEARPSPSRASYPVALADDDDDDDDEEHEDGDDQDKRLQHLDLSQVIQRAIHHVQRAQKRADELLEIAVQNNALETALDAGYSSPMAWF